MNSDEAAFLKVIKAAPDDDLSRLVYADWLDEHGRPERAEFIRVQIELAKMPAYEHVRLDLDWSDPKYSDNLKRAVNLRKRERELVDLGAAVVLEESHMRPGAGFDPTAYTWGFRRGFLDSSAMPLAAWIGSECERCRGAGGSCYACRNAERQFTSTGRIPGIGRLIVAAHPIETVVTEHRPYGVGELGVWYRFGATANEPETQAHVPSELFDMLPRVERLNIAVAFPHTKTFNSVEAASVAWSKVLIRWAEQ